MNAKFEQHLDDELQERLGDVMEKSKDMEALVAISKQTVVNRDAEIEMLQVKADTHKAALKEEKKRHAETIEELATIHIRIQR